MIDVRITGYVTPVAEQPQASLTPVIAVQNFADEDAVIHGLIRIYRESTGLMIYSSELAITQLAHHTSANIAALTPFDPPEPADDDYFVKADIVATSFLPGPPMNATLGSFYFDIKTPPMGAAPAGHHATHEDGGSDPVDVSGLSGELADDQPPKAHHASHEPGGSDRVLPVVVDEASSATPTPDVDDCDQYNLTALGDAATFAAPTGTPVDGQKLIIRILDDGTARALAWDNGAGGYIARGVALPTTTVLSKYLFVGLIYNAIANKWDCVATSNEA
jgi:hypothetical protein